MTQNIHRNLGDALANLRAAKNILGALPWWIQLFPKVKREVWHMECHIIFTEDLIMQPNLTPLERQTIDRAIADPSPLNLDRLVALFQKLEDCNQHTENCWLVATLSQDRHAVAYALACLQLHAALGHVPPLVDAMRQKAYRYAYARLFERHPQGADLVRRLRGKMWVTPQVTYTTHTTQEA